MNQVEDMAGCTRPSAWTSSLSWNVYAGYATFIESHPLAEIDAEKYRPLMQYYMVEHYEEVRRFYRLMFNDKKIKEWLRAISPSKNG